MGVNKNRVISLVFLLGGLMAGVAAVLYDLKIGDAKYDVGFLLGHRGVHRGGARRHRQPARRAARRSAARRGGELRAPAVFGTQYQRVVGLRGLIVILMFRPTGLLGESLGRARA